ncbi:MAG: thiamine biosynthesis protein ThiS [Flavipsychrobacter sp.]|jgi:sulfur carrier protein|nr:thiamine biosynthesis protein ThiS [Flavipsychrobacter sp.]
MNIYINSKPQELSSDSKITDALALLNITAQKGIAIAINNNVIPKSEWDTYILQEEDKVMLIRAAQGG